MPPRHFKKQRKGVSCMLSRVYCMNFWHFDAVVADSTWASALQAMICLNNRIKAFATSFEDNLHLNLSWKCTVRVILRKSFAHRSLLLSCLASWADRMIPAQPFRRHPEAYPSRDRLPDVHTQEHLRRNFHCFGTNAFRYLPTGRHVFQAWETSAVAYALLLTTDFFKAKSDAGTPFEVERFLAQTRRRKMDARANKFIEKFFSLKTIYTFCLGPTFLQRLPLCRSAYRTAVLFYKLY